MTSTHTHTHMQHALKRKLCVKENRTSFISRFGSRSKRIRQKKNTKMENYTTKRTLFFFNQWHGSGILYKFWLVQWMNWIWIWLRLVAYNIYNISTNTLIQMVYNLMCVCVCVETHPHANKQKINEMKLAIFHKKIEASESK